MNQTNAFALADAPDDDGPAIVIELGVSTCSNWNGASLLLHRRRKLPVYRPCSFESPWRDAFTAMAIPHRISGDCDDGANDHGHSPAVDPRWWRRTPRLLPI